jgi:hypothetical protein
MGAFLRSVLLIPILRLQLKRRRPRSPSDMAPPFLRNLPSVRAIWDLQLMEIKPPQPPPAGPPIPQVSLQTNQLIATLLFVNPTIDPFNQTTRHLKCQLTLLHQTTHLISPHQTRINNLTRTLVVRIITLLLTQILPLRTFPQVVTQNLPLMTRAHLTKPSQTVSQQHHMLRLQPLILSQRTQPPIQATINLHQPPL